MKNWKALIAGFLVLCLLPLMTPYPVVRAEEGGEEQETEDPVPESYYYEIESNQIPGWPQGPQIESAAAAVMDMDTGTFLYSKNATAKMYPASITKIMTTLLLVENCDLDEEITFSEIVYDIEEGSSHLGIQPGEKMTLRDAAYGMMLASANDICNGIAEYMCGSISAFSDLMNARAAEIGCVNTHFANPHGLFQEDHYTCAYDMALIAQTAYGNPLFREIAATREYTIPETNVTEEERSFLNHHKMLQRDEEYYQDWCTGGKNGFTSDSLNTLVTYGEKDGKRLVSVVLRINGADKAYNESTQILRYGFENFYTKNVETDGSERRFCDIIGVGYLGEPASFQPSVWKQIPAEKCSGRVILPNTAQTSDLTCEVVEEAGSKKVFSYKYEDCQTGTAEGVFRTVFAPVQYTYQTKSDAVKEVSRSASASGSSIQIESLNEVLDQTTTFFTNGYRMFREYAESHFLTVLTGGMVLLVVLVLFIILLVFRCTSESRIKRRRKQEEEERRRREEEIERMTTAEIEAELRAVMEQERLRKEQELAAQAEAERAAEEARIMEEKAHETERLIDELEKERRERLASKE